MECTDYRFYDLHHSPRQDYVEYVYTYNPNTQPASQGWASPCEYELIRIYITVWKAIHPLGHTRTRARKHGWMNE